MHSSSERRVGLYAWGGPGTIDLLNTKYHSPRIDEQSFMSLYEPPYLETAKQLFGVTDMWVTYSWGFSETTEQPHRAFITSRLKNFAEQKMKTHAYIQGFNLVYDEFKQHDLWCRDGHGNRQPYSRGRSFTCPNNPLARAIILDRVRTACRENFDGIYIDNIIFGLPPFYVRSNFISFFGCSCEYCKQEFKNMFGYSLPLEEKRGKEIQDYLQFRSQKVTSFIAEAATLVHTAHKEFGVNLSDPYQHNSKVYCGYNLAEIKKYLNYYLIENYAHPAQSTRSNDYLTPLLAENKPTFIVSYKNAIGFEPAFTQRDIDAVFTESQKLGYSPCLKVSEFTTNGIWHTLDLSTLTAPHKIALIPQKKVKQKTLRPSRGGYLLSRPLQRYYTPIVRSFFEHQSAYKFATTLGMYKKNLSAFHNFEI